MLNRWAEFTFTETESENASKETFHVFARKVSNVLNYLTATKLQPESMISFSLRLSHWAMRLHTAALGNNKHTLTHTHTFAFNAKRATKWVSNITKLCNELYSLCRLHWIKHNLSKLHFEPWKRKLLPKKLHENISVDYNFELTGKSVNTTADEWSVMWLHATYFIKRCRWNSADTTETSRRETPVRFV